MSTQSLPDSKARRRSCLSSGRSKYTTPSSLRSDGPESAISSSIRPFTRWRLSQSKSIMIRAWRAPVARLRLPTSSASVSTTRRISSLPGDAASRALRLHGIDACDTPRGQIARDGRRRHEHERDECVRRGSSAVTPKSLGETDREAT